MLLEMVAECEIYFTTNWTATSIQIEDKDFDYTGLDTWISLYFAPVLNARIGFDGRRLVAGKWYGSEQLPAGLSPILAKYNIILERELDEVRA